MTREEYDFIEAMKDNANDGSVISLDDAITHALTSVTTYDGTQWFGKIGSGTFYADLDRHIWYPNISPSQALYSLNLEIGELMTENLMI